MKKHWYITHIYTCPVCFREGHRIRERVYTKPKSHYEYHDDYDYCDY